MNKIILQGESEKASNIYYEVARDQQPIGVGGMGQVFAGVCVNQVNGSMTPVAIKFLYSDLPERAIERSRREAMVQLRNDNVIRMYAFIETENSDEHGSTQKRYHVVSELLNGVSLSDLLKGNLKGRNGLEIGYAAELYALYQKDPVRFAKIVMKNVLSGLMALHDLKYIHRDIDPSNIMITDDKHIKLIDFGICKEMDSLTMGDRSLTVAGSFMGKPEFASPELVLGDLNHQDYTTDIYAMGILLFQCITGHVPFEGDMNTVLNNQLHNPLPLKEIKDSGMKRIIKKACEKERARRYQTAAEMRVDIESLDVTRAADPRKRMMMIGAAAVLVLVIGCCWAGIAVHNANVEEERIALQEKAYSDSLLNIINVNVQEAEKLASQGYEHDEDYDQLLLQAKQYFDIADQAKGQLKDDSDAPAYAVSKDKLIEALNKCVIELTEKCEELQDDEDPEVQAEVANLKERIELIKNSVNE